MTLAIIILTVLILMELYLVYLCTETMSECKDDLAEYTGAYTCLCIVVTVLLPVFGILFMLGVINALFIRKPLKDENEQE